MSSIDDIAGPFESLKKSLAEGRLSHAYLMVGSPRGNGLALAESLLKLLYCSGSEKPCGQCTACGQVEEHRHPDIHWLEPESKGRVIKIDQIRSLIKQISQTPFVEGGWKAAVILYADRLNEESQNAFLKTLEEPPGRSLLLLIAEAPQSLLPTIVSRCQRLVVASGQGSLGAQWQEALVEVLRQGGPANPMDVFLQSGRLTSLMEQIQESIENADDSAEEPADEDGEPEVVDARVRARVLEAQAAVFQQMMLWNRDVLLCRLEAEPELLHFPEEIAVLREQAAKLTPQQALERVATVEDMARRLQRHMPDEIVFEAGLMKGLAPRRRS
ncbi:MAG: hypothetical protein A2X46_06660 [Lentisphaerae bacterium GWF2_57_35]|nr:MAG: hypothetical protein A2X46_06660 [Lentisphaerae bacterium GWF2_57_35]